MHTLFTLQLTQVRQRPGTNSEQCVAKSFVIIPSFLQPQWHGGVMHCAPYIRQYSRWIVTSSAKQWCKNGRSNWVSDVLSNDQGTGKKGENIECCSVTSQSGSHSNKNDLLSLWRKCHPNYYKKAHCMCHSHILIYQQVVGMLWHRQETFRPIVCVLIIEQGRRPSNGA